MSKTKFLAHVARAAIRHAKPLLLLVLPGVLGCPVS